MMQKAEDLKRFISHQFDVYKKRIEIIEKKQFRDIFYEEKTITPLKDENGIIRNYVSFAQLLHIQY